MFIYLWATLPEINILYLISYTACKTTNMYQSPLYCSNTWLLVRNTVLSPRNFIR